jgi:hypothetical protein
VKRSLAVAILALLVAPAFGQQHSAPANAPKPTKADAEKVAQIISGDQAKLQAYCDSKKLYDRIGAAYKKNDTKTADALNKQADALVGKIGPEYSKLMDGLEQIDQNSSEGKQFTPIFAGLDKLCNGPGAAQPAQASPAQAAPAHAAPAQAAPGQPAPDRPAAGQSAPDDSAQAKPCAQIREACLQAGFIPNGVNMGVGIIVDCIRPIMTGAPQRQRAAKPLPQIAPQLVAACKSRNPNFGSGAKSPSGGQSMDAPDQ